MLKLKDLEKELKSKADKEGAKVYSSFFKTGKGQYGEGDYFLGITMPQQRLIAKKYTHLSIKEIEQLIHSKVHEYRMTALIIWTYQYKEADRIKREKIYKAYIKNLKWINNWDLIDVTTPRIVGGYLLDKDRKILYKLAKSKNLWERRVAILTTFNFITKNDFKDALKISEILLKDEHALIHKAVGWMLREVGKRDIKQLEKFLKKYYKKMPRTMLRYSIEKFSEKKRKKYLLGNI
ncbi:DNA alkylation repair protein [Candidatus Wolfebacteria bacterium]|nr:DNA alkylation repair protein [Candidatus Wolfebacteria bacterium]